MESSNLIDSDAAFVGHGRKKRVTLIACPWTFYDVAEFRSQQLGLGYVGAYVKEKFGHEIVAYIDPMMNGGDRIKVPIATKYQKTNRFGISDEEIVRMIPVETDVIGINAPFTDSRIVLYPLVRKIKAAFPKVPVVIGGVLATTLPHQVLEESGADIVVKGEGEVAFARILNGEALSDIPGLVFRHMDGCIIEHSERSQQLRSPNSIPPPGYDFRPMAEYVQWSPRGNKADRTLSLISSRGCPFTCEFCSIPEKGQLWRPFTPARVIDEINMAVEKWGVNHIEFEDDNFTLSEERALQVLGHLKKIRSDGYPITCSFPNGIMIDRLTKDLTVLLREAGAEIVYLPVESGDTRVLISMDKPDALNHLEKTLRVAAWCVEAGLRVSCFLIIGYPGGEIKSERLRRESRSRYADYLMENDGKLYMRGEDRASFENTLAFCGQLRDLGVSGITPLIATPYPGTDLYSFCKRFGYLAFEDETNVLTTVSYAAMRPEFVQIKTPWCTQQEAFDRWQEVARLFPVFHNVRKNQGDERLLRGQDLK